MNPSTKTRRLPRAAALGAAAILSIAGWAACGPDDPGTTTEKSCTLDGDCEAGYYCSASGVCTQDCDPSGATGQCGEGQSCSERGRCVDDGPEDECEVASDCDSAPGGDPFCDGDTSVQPMSVGRCEAGDAGAKQCSYDDARTPCEEGCDDATGLCAEPEVDPCDGVMCQMPPEDTCKDNTVLLTYSEQGTCNAGDCSYEEIEVTCANGCADGACEEAVCGPMACADVDPPEAFCSTEELDVAVFVTGGPTCVDEDGMARCVFDFGSEHCAYTGADCVQGSCEGPIPQSGEVVITEYMVNAEGTGGTRFYAQWIEVYNTTGTNIDLNGWTIRYERNNQVDEHVIDNRDAMDAVAPLIVPAGGRLVLANGADPFFDGATAPGYQYDGIVLEFDGALSLVDLSGGVSDFLYWEEGATIRAHSRQLDPQITPSADANDSIEAWCPNLTDPFGNGDNTGTPGADNTACAADPCAGFTCGDRPDAYCNAQGNAVTFTQDAAMCLVSRFNNPFCDFEAVEEVCVDGESLCLSGACEQIPDNLPQPGEVIFTEFMGNPSGSDTQREWLEIHNATDAELSLFTLRLEDNEAGSKYDSWDLLDPSLTIPARGYVVFGPNADAMTNGGVADVVEIGTGLLKNSPDEDAMTGESLMRIRLVTREGALIDEAYYGKPTDGASQQLDLGSYSGAGATDPAGSNDGPANFCDAAGEYSAVAGKGTPGADNEACP